MNPVIRKTAVLSFLPVLLTACDAMSPEARRQALHLPPPGFQGIVAEGVEAYNRYCSVCHGVRGGGTNQGPPLVNRVYRSDHHSNLSFHVAVRDGVKAHHWSFGDMQPVPLVTPEEIEHVIAYIRSEQRKIGIR